jgi:tetratricopeptide (TPR) repeat protein
MAARRGTSQRRASLRGLADRVLQHPQTLVPLLRARRLEYRRDWAGAASVLEAAVAHAPSDAELHRRLGRVHRHLFSWARAEEAYRAALALERRPETLADLALVLQRQRRLDEAAAAHRLAADEYREMLARDDSNQAWRADLGSALEEAGDLDGARRVYEELIARDPEATDVDRQLLEAAVRRFPMRRSYVHFVHEHLQEIRERTAAGAGERSMLPSRIWVYWGQGFDKAPPIVRRCHEELMRHHTEDEVVLLDDAGFGDYVEIPNVARRRTSRDRTKFSDVLRLELLSRHGGVWLDATCLVSRRLFDVLPELLPSGFFAFRRRPALIASWFLASEPRHPLVTLAREAQYVYWEHFRRPLDYYVLHHLVESLYHVADEARECLDATPLRSARPGSLVARAGNEPYDPERYAELLTGCFVHKLTHKLPQGQAKPGSMLDRLLRDGKRP